MGPKTKLALGIGLGLVAVPILATAGFFAIGPERVLTFAIGPADQGPVEIATLDRRARPTDSLACTPSLCAARTDLDLAVYAVTPQSLIAQVDAVILADAADVARVDDGRRPLYRRYVARTVGMRFADTIDVMAAPMPGGAGLMIYGRSQIGIGDWGVNRARIEGWIVRLGTPRPGARRSAGTPVS